MADPTFAGLHVRQTPLLPIPAIQIDPMFVWCTPQFRRDFNAWLLERFGQVHTLEFTDELGRQVFVCSPQAYFELQKLCRPHI